MDDFADYLSTHDQETINAFLYLNDAKKEEVKDPQEVEQFFKIPLKNRLEANELLKECYGTN